MRYLELATLVWIAAASLVAFTQPAVSLAVTPSARPYGPRIKQPRRGGLHIFTRQFQRKGRSSTSKWKQLYCATGYHLQIHPNGHVNGTQEIDSKFAIMEIRDVSVSMVTIKGVATGKYLCMNRRGRIQGRNLSDQTSGAFDDLSLPQNKRRRECVFEEQETPHHWVTYMSYENSQGRRKSFLGISAQGKVKRGRNRRKKFTHFQVRTVGERSKIR